MRKSEFFIREFPVVELRVWSDDAKHAAKSYQNIHVDPGWSDDD
jgi:hypothetical protein